MLERVAKVIKSCQEKPKYVVKISKVWECWDDEKCVMASDVHSHVQDLCDKLNALYCAKKAVEALKLGENEINWPMTDKDVKGFEEWNRNINAILSSDK